jgi:PKD repeat protein
VIAMRRKRVWWSRGLGVALLVPFLLWLGGCWLFNVDPTASFTVSAVVIVEGDSIQFSAIRSSDEDGTIVSYDWDFGDGADGTGQTVAHTYTTAGTYTVFLRVTDDRGATGSTQKMIYVEIGVPAGPTASFTASPTSGASPLGVTFNASASTSPVGTLTYAWTFGDGGVGTGQIVSHTYFSGTARTYTVTLTVTASDGRTATTSASIAVTVPGGGGTPAAGAPTARFDIVDDATLVGGPAGTTGVAPYNALFDPQDTKAATGKTLAQLIWSFGDAGTATTPNVVQQWHTYVTDDPSKVFSVMLLVLDNENVSNSITKTVKVYNHQPIAGFEVCNPAGGHTAADDDEEYATEALADAANRWDDDDDNDGVILGDLQHLAGATVNVFLRSRLTTDVDWFTLVDTGAQDTLTMAEGVLAAPGTTKPVPDDYTGAVASAKQFSYDPEGQYWFPGVEPAWFPNQAWGIQWIYVDWDDGGPEEQFNYEQECSSAWPALPYYDQDCIMMHPYAYPGGNMTKTITIRVVDFLGGQATLSRKVYFVFGTEGADDL